MNSTDEMIDPAAPVDHDPCQAGERFRGGAGDDAALIQRIPRRIDSTDACMMDTTSAFDQLLQGAAAQPEPQRLLFVFAAAQLPKTPRQRNGPSPNAEQVDLTLQTMGERVRGGMLESFLAPDKSGEALQFV